jgi:hypothetical protein
MVDNQNYSIEASDEEIFIKGELSFDELQDFITYYIPYGFDLVGFTSDKWCQSGIVFKKRGCKLKSNTLPSVEISDGCIIQFENEDEFHVYMQEKARRLNHLKNTEEKERISKEHEKMMKKFNELDSTEKV